jgi:hypothetical protein
MPKRVIDFDAMWASDKLASCEESVRGEYAWLYGLADANGSFEITNLRAIVGRVSVIRPKLTVKRIEHIFKEFFERGLMFIWEQDGKKYAHWTGSDKPGRLPVAAHRARYLSLAPQVPKNELVAYCDKLGLKTSGLTPDSIRTGIGFGIGIGIGLEGTGAEMQCSKCGAWFKKHSFEKMGHRC